MSAPAASAPQGSPRAASAVGFLYWTGWQVIVPFIALYATTLGARPAAVGAILGSYSVLALLLSVPAGVLVERMGSGRMMFAGCAIGGASLVLIVYGGGLSALTIGLALLGLSQIMVSIGTQVETILGAAQKDLARSITVYFFFSSASQVVGPAIGAALVRGGHYPAAFLGAAALSAGAMLASGGPARVGSHCGGCRVSARSRGGRGGDADAGQPHRADRGTDRDGPGGAVARLPDGVCRQRRDLRGSGDPVCQAAAASEDAGSQGAMRVD